MCTCQGRRNVLGHEGGKVDRWWGVWGELEGSFLNDRSSIFTMLNQLPAALYVEQESKIDAVSILLLVVTYEGYMYRRAVARSENLGGHVILGGNNVPPLVEIGLTDLPKGGGARAPPAPRLRRACNVCKKLEKFNIRPVLSLQDSLGTCPEVP